LSVEATTISLLFLAITGLEEPRTGGLIMAPAVTVASTVVLTADEVMLVVAVVVVIDVSVMGEHDLEMLWSDSGDGLKLIDDSSAVLLTASSNLNPGLLESLRSRHIVAVAVVVVVVVVVFVTVVDIVIGALVMRDMLLDESKVGVTGG